MGILSRPEHEEEPPRPARPSAAPARAPAPQGPQGANTVLALQRTAGNQAVGRMLARDPASLITTGQLTANWRRAREAQPWAPTRPGIRFRLPTAASITAMMTAGEVPETKIKESVETALKRMQQEKLLTTADPVPVIMNRLFPAVGKFDEVEFAKVVDTTDRNRIYEKAADAEAQVSPTDKVNLIAAMGRARLMMIDAANDAVNLRRVFGTRAADAKKIYVDARAALKELKKNIDTNVHTDYNRDDPQVFLGGWADFFSQTVHLSPRTVSGLDPVEAALTIVHECTHLASQTVLDNGGYYPAAAGTGWEGRPDDAKVESAAHFEEIPRRKNGKSVFGAKEEFKPGLSSGGAPITFEQEVRLEARDRMRRAWDAAVDVHNGMRKVRVAIEKGDTAPFTAKEARILEVSKVAKLTIHEQKPKPHTVDTLDLTLTEGVARGMKRIQAFLPAQVVPPAPQAPKTKQDHVDDVVAGAAAAYGALAGNPVDDKALIDWMVANYQNTGML